MKKAVILFALVLALSAYVIESAVAAPQSVTGVISDSMCIKKHMMPGKSSAQCIQECVKAGSKYVLVVRDKVFTLNSKAADIAPYAGKRVRVQGQTGQSTIDVTSIREAN